MLILEIWLAALLPSTLPFLSVGWLWQKKAKGRADWALRSFIVGALVLLAFIATPWALTSYYLRYLLVLLFAVAAFFSFRRAGAGSPATTLPLTSITAAAVKIVCLAALLLLDGLALHTYFYPTAPVELVFPLSGGVYCALQGGNSWLTNPFHRRGTDKQETYAVDIVKLNWAGNRAAGVYPRALNAYTVYGATVYSPCAGEIIELVDGMPDNPIGDAGRPPSNHVVIRCQGVRVTLAHMAGGSFSVRRGQSVQAGQPLARVGNAGQTIEPHLHMDAVTDSPDSVEPLPMSFGGRVLSTNSVVIR